MNSEARLLERVRQMDERALVEVYDAYNQELFRYACALLGNADLAEECVAETFSRFLNALSRNGGPNQHLRAYLYRVAHNWICDRQRRRPPLELPLDENLPADVNMHSSLSTISDPARAPIDPLERQQLLKAMNLLTDDQRQVIGLKYLANFSNEEIAQALGKPVGAIKSLQFRALAALRRMLSEDNEGSPLSRMDRYYENC